jgi:hypothetical protein
LAFKHQRESTKKRESFFLELAEQIVKPLSKTKTYITGGFKTVGAMVKALEAVDGVGLARPACQEFRLLKDMLSGKLSGAIKQQLNEDDFASTNQAAGTMIRQVGKDGDPIEMSKKECGHL